MGKPKLMTLTPRPASWLPHLPPRPESRLPDLPPRPASWAVGPAPASGILGCRTCPHTRYPGLPNLTPHTMHKIPRVTSLPVSLRPPPYDLVLESGTL